MAHLMKVLTLFLGVALIGLIPPSSKTASAYSKLPESPAFLAPQLLPEQKVLAEHLAQKYRQPLYLVERIVQAAYLEGLRRGLPPLLLLAIMEKESSFRHSVKNSYGAVGLMQVVPRFHPEKLLFEDPVEELKLPERNIAVGAQILAEYLKSKKGNLSAALQKYSGNATRYSESVYAYKRELEKTRALCFT